jgi:hypothetical protein
VVSPDFAPRQLSGHVVAAADCVYVSAELGRGDTVGIPLARILALEIDASDVDPRIPRDPPAWMDVNLNAVFERQPERCEGQPFTKITPLKRGILIAS